MSTHDIFIMPPADPISLDTLELGLSGAPEIGKIEEKATGNATSLALLSRRLLKVFEAINTASTSGTGIDNRMLDELANTITLLQDDFVDALYEKLRAIGANTSSKLTLRLNDAAQLIVAGEHPDAAAINRLLENERDLIEIFTEIATQSAALRDLRNLHILTLYERSEDAYKALAARPGESFYQLSLKGEMNHFYFTR